MGKIIELISMAQMSTLRNYCLGTSQVTLMPDLKWCCSGFEAHLLKREEAWSRDCSHHQLQGRGVLHDTKLEGRLQGGFAINFCP
jgi:hypothetical protein